MRNRKLKVYGWQSYRNESTDYHLQTREIVAATSMKAAAEAAGYKYAYQLNNLCETGNEGEIQQAMSKPGKVFWKSLNDSLRGCAIPWNETEEREDLPTSEPAPWPEIEPEKCEDCKVVDFGVISRLNITDRPKLCPDCFHERKRQWSK